MKRKTRGNIIKGAAVAIDVAVPLVATLTQFPVWVEKSSEATVSGLFLLLACICVIPFFKQIKAFIKSPSVWGVWIIVFVMLLLLQNIINEMLIVAFAGVVSNVIGAGIYKWGEIVGSEEKVNE